MNFSGRKMDCFSRLSHEPCGCAEDQRISTDEVIASFLPETPVDGRRRPDHSGRRNSPVQSSNEYSLRPTTTPDSMAISNCVLEDVKERTVPFNWTGCTCNSIVGRRNGGESGRKHGREFKRESSFAKRYAVSVVAFKASARNNGRKMDWYNSTTPFRATAAGG